MSSHQSPEAASLKLLRGRVYAIPDIMRSAADCLPARRKTTGVVLTTGIGLAEAPARALAHQLRINGVNTRFEPLSSFHHPPRADSLILFSQGLSPNTMLAMRACEEYRHRWLFTSSDTLENASPATRAALDRWRKNRGAVIALPLPPEPDMLLRVIGPAVMTATALALFNTAGRAPSDLMREAAESVSWFWRMQRRSVCQLTRAALNIPVALMAPGPYAEILRPMAWKWMEALWRPEPPCWDLLQFAHGPMQSLFNSPWRFVVFLPGLDSQTRNILERFRKTLDRKRHRVITLPVRSDWMAPLSMDSAMNQLILRALELRPMDLSQWPGQGREGKLYGYTGEEP
ncbi:MAG: hypothetical protein GMKNLPBB_02792 [Myxococcota bacterium]|nr:hypothetical protein [Myxococcota bacterium]